MNTHVRTLSGAGGGSQLSTHANLQLRGPQIFYAPNDDTGAGTGDSTGGTDNTQGNSGAGTNDSGGTNNTGGENTFETFWEEPESPKGKSPSGGSADSNSGSSGDEAGSNYGKELMTQLGGLDFGGQVFTPEIAEQIANGDLKGANERFQQQQRMGVQHALVMSAQLMQKYGDSLMTRVKNEIQTALGGEKNTDTLLSNFPAAKNPAIRPMIQGVFDQSMKHTGGNRDKAVAMTKDMLKFMGQAAGAEMDINRAPTNAEDSYNSQSATDLVKELLGR